MKSMTALCVLLVAGFALIAPAQAEEKSNPSGLKVSGRIFADVSSQTRDINGHDVTSNQYGIELKRFYVAFDQKLSDKTAFNITTDFLYSGRTTVGDFFVKKAYVEHKFSKAVTMRVGAFDMPWPGYVDGITGTRYVEKSMTDRVKWANTADWGVHLGGELSPNWSYAASVVTGSGYREATLTKSLDVDVRLNAKYGNWQFGVGGYTGKLGQDTDAAPARQTATRATALAAYVTPKFKVGLEYAKTSNFSASRIRSLQSDEAEGYSAFASFKPNDKLMVFGRIDRIEPSKTLSPTKENDFDMVGVSYPITKTLDAAVVAKRLYTRSGSTRTTDNTIGVFLQYRY